MIFVRGLAACAPERGLRINDIAALTMHGVSILLYLLFLAPVLAPHIYPSAMPEKADDQEIDKVAQAQDAGHAWTGHREGSYFIGAYGGVPYTYPSDVSVLRPNGTDFTLHKVPWRGEPFKSPVYYGVRIAGWSERLPFGAMIDFTHSKAISERDAVVRQKGTLNNKPMAPKARIDETFRKLEFSHGHNMLTLNGLYRLPARIGSISPYFGAGAGISIPHTEIRLREDLTRTYEYQYTGPALQALFGLEIQLPKMSVFLEYKFTFADYRAPLTYRNGSWVVQDLWAQFNNWRTGKSSVQGALSTRLTSHQLIGGLGVRLVRPTTTRTTFN